MSRVFRLSFARNLLCGRGSGDPRDKGPHPFRHMFARLAMGGNKVVAGHTLVNTGVLDADDALIFGPETRGLPQDILERTPHRVRIPIWGEVRSLNLSTAAGIVLYQAFAASGVLDSREISG